VYLSIEITLGDQLNIYPSMASLEANKLRVRVGIQPDVELNSKSMSDGYEFVDIGCTKFMCVMFSDREYVYDAKLHIIYVTS